jgi:predicted peptidase
MTDDSPHGGGMFSRRQILVVGAGSALLLACSRVTAATGHIESATAVTEVFGDGLKLTAIALAYDRPIAGTALSAASFGVAGRTITEVFTSSSPDPAGRAPSGRYVIIRLSPDDAGAPLKVRPLMGPGGPGPHGASGGPPPGMGPAGSRPQGPAQSYKPATASVIQTGPLTTTDGAVYPASGDALATSAVRNLIVDDFRQLVFHDPKTGDTLKYNLFVPKGYDPTKRYPLVLFMHDAGVTGPDPLSTLRQGLGAVVWASPEEQAKHPCFVLAPQYEEIIVDDTSTASSALDTTIHLVEALAAQYSVDRDRLYTTGQSGGAASSPPR